MNVSCRHSIRASSVRSVISEDQRCSLGLTAGYCSAIAEIQRQTHLIARTPLANRESDVSHPHAIPPPSAEILKTNLSRHHREVPSETVLPFFPLLVCVCCQMGDACGAFTGAQGWAVVLAVSGRATS